MRLRDISGILIPVVAVMAVMPSCGCDSGSVSRHVRDRRAYTLGREHGQKVAGLRGDEPALQEALLDVRARMTNIHDRLGPQSAADYERGFTDYIRANDDSLARILF